jgi:hypothetical protein
VNIGWLKKQESLASTPCQDSSIVGALVVKEDSSASFNFNLGATL